MGTILEIKPYAYKRVLISKGLVVALLALTVPKVALAEAVFTEWYWTVVFTGPWVLVVGVFMFLVYLFVQKRRGRVLSQSHRFKIMAICFGIAIVGFLLYDYYLDNRTGIFNPYTQTCVEEGYSGAKGYSCY
ncbi:hypothetical protein CL654_00290 [bacterium]|nr:hypothetical protein [bacterium]|tara:strand:+ start:126 stop:521 length:396 start_codon:yes stop_codon:yes gene_type:complete